MNTEDTRTTGLDVAEPSVESCLRELREMFPGKWLEVVTGSHPVNSNYYKIRVYGMRRMSARTSLSECMAQVRSWKQEQEKSNV